MRVRRPTLLSNFGNPRHDLLISFGSHIIIAFGNYIRFSSYDLFHRPVIDHRGATVGCAQLARMEANNATGKLVVLP